MIRSFGDEATSDFFNGINSARARRIPADIHKKAINKLALLNAATDLPELATPPGNRLHPLKGDRAGFHAISINDQWRIVFRWEADGPHQVRIEDYH